MYKFIFIRQYSKLVAGGVKGQKRHEDTQKKTAENCQTNPKFKQN